LDAIAVNAFSQKNFFYFVLTRKVTMVKTRKMQTDVMVPHNSLWNPHFGRKMSRTCVC